MSPPRDGTDLDPDPQDLERTERGVSNRLGVEECLRLSPEVDMVRTARRFVADRVRCWAGEPTDAAELLTSEAMTNAVCHADTDYIEITVGLHGDRVHVQVHDQDPSPPTVRPVDPERIGGRGMHLIHALSSEWGVTEINGDGKRVWFELELQNRP